MHVKSIKWIFAAAMLVAGAAHADTVTLPYVANDGSNNFWFQTKNTTGYFCVPPLDTNTHAWDLVLGAYIKQDQNFNFAQGATASGCRGWPTAYNMNMGVGH